jgi:hypothetical protein
MYRLIYKNVINHNMYQAIEYIYPHFLSRTAYPIRCLTWPTQTRQYIVVFHIKTLIHCFLKYYLRSSTLRVFKKISSTPENRNLDTVVAFRYKLWKMLDAQGGFVYDVSLLFPSLTSYWLQLNLFGAASMLS